MKRIEFGLLPLVLATCCVLCVVSAAQSRAAQNASNSIANTSWRGAIGDPAKGNSPAELRIVLQDGSLTGVLIGDGYEETFVITMIGVSNIRMKGVSVRDLKRQGRTFYLDTFNGELSPDGRQIKGTAVDSRGNGGRWEFSRTSGR